MVKPESESKKVVATVCDPSVLSSLDVPDSTESTGSFHPGGGSTGIGNILNQLLGIVPGPSIVVEVFFVVPDFLVVVEAFRVVLALLVVEVRFRVVD